MDTILHQSPPRLSERRGKPELVLDPMAAPVIPPPNPTIDVNQQSISSSVRSGILQHPDPYEVPAVLGPVTPPVRKFISSPFGTTTTSVVGSPIKEEEEEEEEEEEKEEEEEGSTCGCQECSGCDRYGTNGLGLDVSWDSNQQDMVTANPDTNPHSQYPFDDPSTASHYLYDQKLAPVTMPPTPPSQMGERSYVFAVGERPYGFSAHTSPILHTIDADAFSSGPPSLPQSPQSETTRSRTATILNKVVPFKLRASLKRRLSSPNSPLNNQPPPLPPLSTMPTYPAYTTVSAPGTPPDDIYGFGELFMKRTKSPSLHEESMSMFSSVEAILPPMFNPLSPASNGPDSDSYISSPRPSPIAGGVMSWMASTEVFPEMSLGSADELVKSPLHPPTRSPLMSPSITCASQTSLTSSTFLSHKKVPSIDPATPLAPRKAAVPLTLVTANSLADMIEEMNTDLDAYDTTRIRMIESGWSSPQEIKNVESQRREKARAWQERIAESKKILEGMRRSEVKHSAMSSVSSFDSVGSMSGGAAFSNSHVTPLSATASTTTF